jgi:hypothetical protein
MPIPKSIKLGKELWLIIFNLPEILPDTPPKIVTLL